MSFIRSILLLSVISLTSILSGGCRALHSQPPRPQDSYVIKLGKYGEAPQSKNVNYQLGDPVALIDNNGNFSIGEEIDGVTGKLVFAAHTKGGSKEWLPLEKSYLNDYDEGTIEKTAPAGYKFAYSERNKFYKYYPAEQVFPVPWANSVNLKVGDTVHLIGDDLNNLTKTVISEVPAKRYGKFRVRQGESETATESFADRIYSSIQPAKFEDLSPGEIVSYNQTKWVMVIGKRDGKIIVREASNLPLDGGDELIDAAKLRIVK